MGVPGLRLNLGGAPLTPHVIDGVPGLYWPTHPTPIDIIDGVDEQMAAKLDKDKGVPLAAEDIADEETAEQHRQKYRDELALAAQAGAALTAPIGAETDVRETQTAAVKPKPAKGTTAKE